VAAGQAVSIGPELLATVQQRCTRPPRRWRDGQPVYGVNTGMGALSSVRLTEQQQLSHQRNLLLARATGGPPWLTPPEVRAVITVRLLTFLSGDAAVSAGLCQRLADFLNYGIVPAVPRTGAASAGEIIQLAHAFGPLAGIGQVLGPGGGLIPAREALREAGLTEFSLGPKEGIALIQGVPGVTGLSVLRLGEAAALTSLMERAAALSIIAARAPRDPYRAACGRGDDLLAAVLGRLRAAAGDDPSPRSLQAPVSFRVAGPVLTQVHRAADQLEAATRRALTGVTDSPAYLDGQFTSTAGFHGIDLAAHCDQLTAALCHAAEVAAARLHRLLDPAVTGLPAQLAREPGPQAGLTPVHKRAAGEVHRHAAPGHRDPGRPDRDLRRPGGRAVVRLGSRRQAGRRAAPRPRGHGLRAAGRLPGGGAVRDFRTPADRPGPGAAGLAGGHRRSDRWRPAVRRGPAAPHRGALAPA
jgi:histidine ammonia-lyase